MRGSDGMRTGGEILADQLAIHGVRHVFCVPGESYIAALDGMYGGPIELTVCRQEGGASMMAGRLARPPASPASASSPADPAPPMRRRACILRGRIRRR
jgi:acetolactate synthase-1/2/3 large subunit